MKAFLFVVLILAAMTTPMSLLAVCPQVPPYDWSARLTINIDNGQQSTMTTPPLGPDKVNLSHRVEGTFPRPFRDDDGDDERIVGQSELGHIYTIFVSETVIRGGGQSVAFQKKYGEASACENPLVRLDHTGWWQGYGYFFNTGIYDVHIWYALPQPNGPGGE